MLGKLKLAQILGIVEGALFSALGMAHLSTGLTALAIIAIVVVANVILHIIEES